MMVHNFKKYPELTNRQMELYYSQSPHQQITEDFMARVVKVTDGDTIRVFTSFRNFTFPIRLSNIASPELNERGGLESQQWLEKEILGKEVEIVIDYKNRVEKWGRLLGSIFFGGMDMGEESIANGFSVRFDEIQDTGAIPSFSAELEAIKI